MTIKEITQTIIRGEPVLKFPLRYVKNFREIYHNKHVTLLTIHKEQVVADAIGEWIVETMNNSWKAQQDKEKVSDCCQAETNLSDVCALCLNECNLIENPHSPIKREG